MRDTARETQTPNLSVELARGRVELGLAHAGRVGLLHARDHALGSVHVLPPAGVRGLLDILLAGTRCESLTKGVQGGVPSSSAALDSECP